MQYVGVLLDGPEEDPDAGYDLPEGQPEQDIVLDRVTRRPSSVSRFSMAWALTCLAAEICSEKNSVIVFRLSYRRSAVHLHRQHCHRPVWFRYDP